MTITAHDVYDTFGQAWATHRSEHRTWIASCRVLNAHCPFRCHSAPPLVLALPAATDPAAEPTSSVMVTVASTKHSPADREHTAASPPRRGSARGATYR